MQTASQTQTVLAFLSPQTATQLVSLAETSELQQASLTLFFSQHNKNLYHLSVVHRHSYQSLLHVVNLNGKANKQ